MLPFPDGSWNLDPAGGTSFQQRGQKTDKTRNEERGKERKGKKGKKEEKKEKDEPWTWTWNMFTRGKLRHRSVLFVNLLRRTKSASPIFRRGLA
mmetsp:Transcript_43023/g.111246  ORF Transcript_43023/g.111246 Transcript_43023/m.111246 type:complete len:94 (-) Transcript_43023:2692-2973(-)